MKQRVGVCRVDGEGVRLACAVTEENELRTRAFCTRQKPDEKSVSGAILLMLIPILKLTSCIILAGYITLGDLATSIMAQ